MNAPCAANRPAGPWGSMASGASHAVSAKATPKNVPHRVMASPRRAAGAIAAISVGAATTMPRCDRPSTTREASITGKGGSRACAPETSAPSHRLASKSRRTPTRPARTPVTRPSAMPSTEIKETSHPIAAPASG